MARKSYCDHTWIELTTGGKPRQRWCSNYTQSVTGKCSVHRPKTVKRERKVSTEGKAARGQTPDSGSIPDASTGTNTEYDVLMEDVQDLRDEISKLKEDIAKIKSDVAVALAMAALSPSYPTFPSSPDIKWKSNTTATYPQF